MFTELKIHMKGTLSRGSAAIPTALPLSLALLLMSLAYGTLPVSHSGTSPHLQPQLQIDLRVSGDAHAPSYCLPWADRLFFISPCPLRSLPSPSGPCSHRDSGLVPWALSLRSHPLGRTHTQAMASLVTLLQPRASHPRGNRPLAENCSNMFSYTDLIGLPSSPGLELTGLPTHLPRLNRTHTQGLDPCASNAPSNDCCS